METFSLHKVVRLRDLRSRPIWNHQLAQIVGPYSTKRERYPIILLLSQEKAWIKPINFDLYSYSFGGIADVQQQKVSPSESSNAMFTICTNSDLMKLILSNLIITEVTIAANGCDFPEYLMSVCTFWQRIASSFVTELSFSEISSTRFTQTQLNNIAKYFDNLKSLDITPEYDDYGTKIDFTLVRFAKLEHLNLNCVNLANIHFDRENTPKLEYLSIENSRDCDYLYFDLPEVESIGFQFVTLNDASNFGNSLSRCRKLESFSSYKLWGLSCRNHIHDEGHVIINENLRSLDLYRSDCLDRICLWCPQLSHLNLQACYSLDRVRILKKFPSQYVTQNRMYVNYDGLTTDIDIEEQSEIDINLINANIDHVSLSHLETHQRVANITHDPEDHEFAYL